MGLQRQHTTKKGCSGNMPQKRGETATHHRNSAGSCGNMSRKCGGLLQKNRGRDGPDGTLQVRAWSIYAMGLMGLMAP